MKVTFPMRTKRPQNLPVSRVARMLALAHHIERQVEAGEISSYAEAAAALGLTRARVTQVMKLPLLSPEIQERLLGGELVATDRALRTVVSTAVWNEQLNEVAKSPRDRPQ